MLSEAGSNVENLTIEHFAALLLTPLSHPSSHIQTRSSIFSQQSTFSANSPPDSSSEAYGAQGNRLSNNESQNKVIKLIMKN